MIKGSVIHVTPEPREMPSARAVLLSGGGGTDSTSNSIDARVARLETHMEYVREGLANIKARQKATEAAIATLSATTDKLSSKKIDVTELKLSSQMKDLPTKSDLKNYNLQYIAIGLAFSILLVGGIIGGLILMKT